MPELPEVETVMRGLAACLEGRRIATAAIHRPRLRWDVPAGLAARLRGARVEGFRRRAKYILARLSGGDSLLLHLGMSGRVNIGRDRPDAPARHEHMVLETDHGWRVALVDPRRFGGLDLVATAAEDGHRLLRDLGPEPLEADFGAATLARALAGTRSPVKTCLLDQRLVAGLGNIYVCEALFRARIHPATPANAVPRAAVDALADAIRAVLTEAIAVGGSSLRDYAQPNGELGYFRHAWRVYGREDLPCGGHPDCAAYACPGVRRIVQGGRGTFFCPRLQQEPA